MTQAEIAYKEKLEETDDRDQLILRELPQVYYIARRVFERLPQHMQFEDLVHAGVIGLIESVRTYDTTKSVPFKSYAKFRIRGAIIDSLRQLDWGSRPLRRNGRRIEEAIATLSAKLGRQPEEGEIAEELGISLSKLHEIARRLDGLKLVEQQVNAAYDSSEKHDLIESAPSKEKTPFEQCLRTEIKDQLAKAISTLSEKEQMVLTLYYKEELTMKEIAAVMQLVESRVSQIHAIAIPKLRAALKNGSFDENTI
jgi:RNA polymerase sigma factor for flagellar operon FliA